MVARAGAAGLVQSTLKSPAGDKMLGREGLSALIQQGLQGAGFTFSQAQRVPSLPWAFNSYCYFC